MSAPTDDGLCEQCGDLNNGSTFSPFCSEACELEAEAGDQDEDAEDGEAPEWGVTSWRFDEPGLDY